MSYLLTKITEDKRKPMTLKALREYVMKKHNGVMWANLEADDVLGIMATEPTNEERIVVGIDKDLRTVPCNLSADGLNVEQIPPRMADYNFMIQTLTGDKVDGYDGIEGVGVVTANKLIQKYICSIKRLMENSKRYIQRQRLHC